MSNVVTTPKFKITINEDLTSKIEAAQSLADTRRAVLQQYMDSHALDPDDAAVTSPVLTKYEERASQAATDFSRAKRELEETYFDKVKDQPNIINWSLNYSDCVVTVTMRQGHTLTGIGVEVVNA